MKMTSLVFTAALVASSAAWAADESKPVTLSDTTLDSVTAGSALATALAGSAAASLLGSDALAITDTITAVDDFAAASGSLSVAATGTGVPFGLAYLP